MAKLVFEDVPGSEDADSSEPTGKLRFKDLYNKVSVKATSYKHSRLFEAWPVNSDEFQDIGIFFNLEQNSHWYDFAKEIAASFDALEDVSQYYYRGLWDNYKDTDLAKVFISDTPSKKLILEQVIDLIKDKDFIKSSKKLVREISDFLTHDLRLSIINKDIQKNLVKILLKNTSSQAGSELFENVAPTLVKVLPTKFHSSAVKTFINYLPRLPSYDLLEGVSSDLAKFFTSKRVQKPFLDMLFDTEDMLIWFLKNQPDYFKQVDPKIYSAYQVPVTTLYLSDKIDEDQYAQLTEKLDRSKITDKTLSPKKPITGEKFDPVCALMTKAVTTKTIADSGFGEKFEEALRDIVRKDKSGVISTILKAAVLNGVIVFQDEDALTVDGISALGYNDPKGGIAVVSPLKHHVVIMLATMLHELTHKLTNVVFNNGSKPYFENNKKAKMELRTIEPLFKRHYELSVHKPGNVHLESIAHFIDELTTDLYNPTHNKNKYTLVNIGAFANWVTKNVYPVFGAFSDVFDEIQSHLPVHEGTSTGLVIDYTGGFTCAEIVGDTPKISFVD